LTEECDQFRFLRAACLVNLQSSVGLILTNVSAMRVSIPLDLSTQTVKDHTSSSILSLVVPPLFLLLP
jgi:hypothetical protein